MSKTLSVTGMKRKTVTAAMAALALVAIAAKPLQAQNKGVTQNASNTQNTSVKGVVTSAAGQPVAGALVKIKGDSLAFTVVSQGDGRYTSPRLPAGKYQVQAFGGSNQGASAGPIDITTGQANADVVLNAPLQVPPIPKRLTDGDYAKLMPASEPAEIKEIAISDCKECHTLQWTVTARKSKEKWEETVNRMYHDLLGRRMPLWFALKDDEFVGGKRFGLLIDYLAKNFGPQSPVDAKAVEPWVVPGAAAHPTRNLPQALLSGVAGKYVSMEYSLPTDSTPGDIMPNDIAVDSQGIAWVSERNTGMLGRFDPESLSYTRTASPAGKDPKFQLNAVAVDPQDQVWFVDDGPNARILQFNPKSKEFSSYPIPEYRWAVPDAGRSRIAALRFSNGNVWGSRLTAQKILKLDPRTKKIIEYPIPRGSDPFGLAVTAKDIVWFAAEVGNVVVRLDSLTGELVPHDVPTDRSDLHGMGMDAEGNLWVAATEAGKLVKVDAQTGKAVEFTPPLADAGPYSVDVDTKRNLIWFNEAFTDRIARFDPSNNTFVEFPLPSADLDVRRIEVDRSHPNRVWWSGARAGKIGYIEVLQ
jgi:streptogramin lyase